MKTVYILIVILFTSNFVNAQWEMQNSGVTNCLNSVYFTDINNGYIVGDYGTILKTSDGGANWVPQISGTMQNLNAVKFIDDNIGIIVGDDGTILKTSGGGENWDLINSGTNKKLTACSFADENICYAVGDDINTSAIILKSANKGDNWSIIQNSFSNIYSYRLGTVCFLDADTGFAGGNGDAMTTIIKTTDGGDSWDLIYGGEPYTINSIFFVNNNVGYAVGDGSNILKTINGGDTWTIDDSQNSINKRAIFFTNDSVGYVAIGNGPPNNPLSYKILKTIDTGDTWDEVTSDVDTYLMSLYFVNNDIGFAVGGQGTILKKSNGGIGSIKKSVSKDNTFLIYPTPVKDMLTIETSFVHNESLLIIYDIRGKELKQININKNKTTIDFQEFKKGIYLLSLANQKEFNVFKIVKK